MQLLFPLLNSNFTATNVDNATFRYNSNNGKFELLYKCGNTYSLVGWNDNSFSYDYYDGSQWVKKWDVISDLVLTGKIEGMGSGSLPEEILNLHKILKNYQSVHAELQYGSNSATVIGMRVAINRGRYALRRTSNEIINVRVLDESHIAYSYVTSGSETTYPAE